jgi:hypothetical protein
MMRQQLTTVDRCYTRHEGPGNCGERPDMYLSKQDLEILRVAQIV